MKKSLIATGMGNAIASRSAFSNQKNSDVLFAGDVGAHFKNRYSSHICFADGEEDKGGEPELMPQMTWDQFDQEIEKRLNERLKSQTPPAKKEGEEDGGEPMSIMEQRQQRQKQEQQRQADQSVVQAAAVFDTSFDAFIQENKDLFPETVQTIRKDVTETDLIKKTNLIAATAAKEYFSLQSNIDALDSESKKKVETEILNKRYESNIDGVAAWELVKRSVFGHGLLSRNQKSHDFSGKGGGKTGLAHLDKYIENFYPQDVIAIEA